MRQDEKKTQLFSKKDIMIIIIVCTIATVLSLYRDPIFAAFVVIIWLALRDWHHYNRRKQEFSQHIHDVNAYRNQRDGRTADTTPPKMNWLNLNNILLILTIIAIAAVMNLFHSPILGVVVVLIALLLRGLLDEHQHDKEHKRYVSEIWHDSLTRTNQSNITPKPYITTDCDRSEKATHHTNDNTMGE